MIPLAEYVDFLDREYLRGYVDRGGAAVKFVIPSDDDDAGRFRSMLRERGEASGFVVADVDAAAVKVHMIEQVFFQVAREIDWEGMAQMAALRVLETASYPAAAGEDVSVDAVAARYGVDPRELRRDVDRQLQTLVYRDYAMVQEFRTAMMRLCQASLRTGQVAEAEQVAVLEWLRGDLRQISMLKTALIFRRIARHNARHLLFSLAHWLSANQRAGLLLVLDIRRLAVARRPSPEERMGLYYTKGAALDAYEVIRQLVDNTDEASHCAVVVIAAPEFLSDPSRGVDAYQALKLRIYDEVRDRRRDNPYSSLVRLGAA